MEESGGRAAVAVVGVVVGWEVGWEVDVMSFSMGRCSVCCIGLRHSLPASCAAGTVRCRVRLLALSSSARTRAGDATG